MTTPRQRWTAVRHARDLLQRLTEGTRAIPPDAARGEAMQILEHFPDEGAIAEAERREDLLGRVSGVEPEGYGPAELIQAAASAKGPDLLRVLATYADPLNWRQVHGGTFVGAPGGKSLGCEWAFVGPTRPGYELAQTVLVDLPRPGRLDPAAVVPGSLLDRQDRLVREARRLGFHAALAGYWDECCPESPIESATEAHGGMPGDLTTVNLGVFLGASVHVAARAGADPDEDDVVTRVFDDEAAARAWMEAPATPADLESNLTDLDAAGEAGKGGGP